MMFFEVKMQQDRYRWWNYKLNWKKPSRNDVFRGKLATSKVPFKIFKGLEVRKNVQLMFWRPKSSMKGKCYVFSGDKQRNKACFVYLECKLQQDTYGWYIFKLKCQKTVEKTHLESRKLQKKVPLMFLEIKRLTDR